MAGYEKAESLPRARGRKQSRGLPPCQMGRRRKEPREQPDEYGLAGLRGSCRQAIFLDSGRKMISKERKYSLNVSGDIETGRKPTATRWMSVVRTTHSNLNQQKHMDRSENPRSGISAGYGDLSRVTSGGKDCSWRRKFLGTASRLSALALLFCIGCKGTANHPIPLVSETPNFLDAGDVVKISFPAAPELTQTQAIATDGTLSLALVGEVQAAGKTAAQLQSELSVRYKSQLQDNEVIVTLETRALPVVVSGAVQKPGKIVFERPATVLEAIMEAGGWTPEADLRKVSLIRIVKGEHYSQVYDLRPVLRGQPTRAVYVNRGDVIYVPEKALLF
jgi:polysaccharide export outer membrane protein